MTAIKLLRLELRTEHAKYGVIQVRLDAIVNDKRHTVTLLVYDTDDFVSRIDQYFDTMKSQLKHLVKEQEK